MSFLSRAESWTNIIKNVVIIAGIALAVFFGALSIYANMTEGRPVDNSLPKPPAIDKAQWEVTIKNTGNILYTNSYLHPSDNLYILNGYWEIDGKKYKQHKNDLTLDETYFGDILVKKRGN